VSSQLVSTRLVFFEGLCTNYPISHCISPCPDFSFNKLRGSLPTQLFDSMKHLDSLILQGNLLNQTLPSELAKLTGLETLDLSSNHLSGRLFFPGIDALPNLKILNLANNVFTGPFPASQLTSLNYLQHLLLYQNQLTGTLVEEIGLMTSLVQLELVRVELHELRFVVYMLERKDSNLCICHIFAGQQQFCWDHPNNNW